MNRDEQEKLLLDFLSEVNKHIDNYAHLGQDSINEFLNDYNG